MNIDLTTCLSEDAARTICHGMQEAIDNTRASLYGFPTKNSWPTRFWDEINRYMVDSLMAPAGLMNCEVVITSRGPWLLGIAYSNGIVYSFMREKRFEQLRHEYRSNSEMTHYAISLARVLNIDLPLQEQKLFNDDNGAILDKSRDIVYKVLQQLVNQDKVIKTYVLILFDADETNLYSARMVLLNGALEICSERSLNEYIDIRDSVITESVNDYPDKGSMDPYSNITISAKGQKRLANKKSGDIKKSSSEETENMK